MKKTIIVLLCVLMAVTLLACNTNGSYNVTFMADGQVVSVVKTNYGETAVAPNVPEKEGYVGTWEGDYTNVKSDITITAKYEIRQFNVTFTADDKVVSVVKTNYGETAVAPNVPEKEGYVGTWEGDYTNVKSDITITAKYEKVVILNMLNETKTTDGWEARNSAGIENTGMRAKNGGIYFTYKAPINESEYYVSVDKSKINGTYLVFYMKGSAVPNVFVGFEANDGTKYHTIINGPTGCENGAVVSVALTDLTGLDVSKVEKLELMIQDWTTQGYKLHQMYFSSFAICNSFGLEKYKKDIVDVVKEIPVVNVLNATDDVTDWEASNVAGNEYATLDVKNGGIYFGYRAPCNESEYYAVVDKTLITENNLVFYMKGSAVPTLFVGFVDTDGTRHHVTLNGPSGCEDGVVVVVDLSTIVGLDISKIAKFELMIQDWTTQDYQMHKMFVSTIAICDELGLDKYKQDIAGIVAETAVINVLNDTQSTEGWEGNNVQNPEFAVIEKATDGLTMKYVSSANDSVYTVGVDKTKITEDHLVFYAKGGSASIVLFVGFVDTDGNRKYVTLENITGLSDGKVIDIRISSIEGLDITKVDKLLIMMQDWNTEFGWQEINIRNVAVCNDAGLAKYKANYEQ